MTNEQTPVRDYIISLHKEDKEREDIEYHLTEIGHPADHAHALVNEVLKLHYMQRRSQGITLILCGAFICFLSCILTLTASFSPSNFALILYGLTSVGICVIFIGFMKVF